MGSPLRLTTAAGACAEAAWTEVVAEFAASDAALSRFRDDAELVGLDRAAGTGREVVVSRRLERAVIAADRARRLTDGRFDPRILVDLERIGDRGVPLPLMASPSSLVRVPGGDTGPIVCRHAPGRLRLERPLDLGGIGKGLALRWAAARVEHAGVHDFLLDAGGDLVLRGRPPEGGAWQIGIEDAAGGRDPVAVVEPPDGAVATSSIRRRRWDHDGQAVHHLIDPRTGEPAWTGLAAVTVAGPDPAWAEVWSKTLFLAGRAGIADEARRRGLAAWWIATDGTLEMTPAARALTTWVATEA
ncbi:MAG TPA: FAD:protein FMN transferase [Candidatus Limnocylindrales bacterium]|jgi:thiamine biosynthesis lipoprotein|nr:FAD:protein FMN transferase [Candidatus Limnocylindrales bacterium]